MVKKLYINGFDNKISILTSIKEQIQEGNIAGNMDNAIDNLNQLIEHEIEVDNELYRDDKHQGRLDENGMSIGRGRLW
tara:strand:+ start:2203 stop:2436 length:234 start_codon:yes stop_codon:yes gene_type:complete